MAMMVTGLRRRANEVRKVKTAPQRNGRTEAPFISRVQTLHYRNRPRIIPDLRQQDGGRRNAALPAVFPVCTLPAVLP